MDTIERGWAREYETEVYERTDGRTDRQGEWFEGYDVFNLCVQSHKSPHLPRNPGRVGGILQEDEQGENPSTHQEGTKLYTHKHTHTYYNKRLTKLSSQLSPAIWSLGFALSARSGHYSGYVEMEM